MNLNALFTTIVASLLFLNVSKAQTSCETYFESHMSGLVDGTIANHEFRARSYSNNDDGHLHNTGGFYLQALLEMYLLDSDKKYLDEFIYVAQELLNKRSVHLDINGNPTIWSGKTWFSKKYTASPLVYYSWPYHTGIITSALARFALIIDQNTSLASLSPSVPVGFTSPPVVPSNYGQAADIFLIACLDAYEFHDGFQEYKNFQVNGTEYTKVVFKPDQNGTTLNNLSTPLNYMIRPDGTNTYAKDDPIPVNMIAEIARSFLYYTQVAHGHSNSLISASYSKYERFLRGLGNTIKLNIEKSSIHHGISSTKFMWHYDDCISFNTENFSRSYPFISNPSRTSKVDDLAHAKAVFQFCFAAFKNELTTDGIPASTNYVFDSQDMVKLASCIKDLYRPSNLSMSIPDDVDYFGSSLLNNIEGNENSCS